MDPWVAERVTLVAEQQNRVTAAAHLLRHSARRAPAQDFRDTGEIRWLLFWPEAPAEIPHWADAAAAARQLMSAAWPGSGTGASPASSQAENCLCMAFTGCP